MVASNKGNVDAMKVLLNARADPNIVSVDGSTWLHAALEGDCSKEALQIIIEHGADVNATNKQNITPLMVASSKGNVDAMNVLLNARADPNVTSVDGGTWLHAALEGDCSKEALQVIIEHGTDMNATNKLNITPLELASEKRNINAIVLLLDAGAKPNLISSTQNEEKWQTGTN